MLSVEHIQKLLNNPAGVSDREAEEIRDDFYVLTEIIFEKWQKETQIKNQKVPIPSRKNESKNMKNEDIEKLGEIYKARCRNTTEKLATYNYLF